MPGTDAAGTIDLVLGELAGFAFLPELPGRGAHGDLAGRTAVLLAGLHVDLQPSGWRVTGGTSVDGTRARDALARDLDALQERAEKTLPRLLKVSAAGPWTLATLLELTRGEKLLSDHGAVHDLTASLAEGLQAHLEDVARRVPSARILLQLDEPALPAVLGGRVRTSSGYATLRSPQTQVVREHLRTVIGVTTYAVAHCCAPQPPVELLLSAGAAALSLDATLLTPATDDALGAAVEAGTGLLLGCVPGTDTRLPQVADTLLPVRRLWQRTGLDAHLLPESVVVTPTCGLAGASMGYARTALERCVQAGEQLKEEPL